MKNNTDLAEQILKGTRKAKHLMKNIMEGFDHESVYEGLNSTHFRTLMVLEARGNLCMKDICHLLGIEAGSFTPVADRLMKEGLIQRLPDPHDRRKTLLSPTDWGEEFTVRLKEKIGEHMRKRLSLLSEEQSFRFREALKVIEEVSDLLEG
ncbi:MAG: MarR family transcriptional regulator [Spirochaetales bacterium]|nr:MarR family transcriptional regulator [Spirochaetales bacterium]